MEPKKNNVVFLKPHVAGSDIMPIPSVWLHVGYCVCTTISTHIIDLELRITEAIASIPRQISWNYWCIRSTSTM
jgi:hypothetical protein